jgi:hypothetical protein
VQFGERSLKLQFGGLFNERGDEEFERIQFNYSERPIFGILMLHKGSLKGRKNYFALYSNFSLEKVMAFITTCVLHFLQLLILGLVLYLLMPAALGSHNQCMLL